MVTDICPGPTSMGFEKAAGMKNSKMFTFFRPASARDVAEAGYRASEKGRVLLCYEAWTIIMNIGSRLLPRSVTRKFAAAINGPAAHECQCFGTVVSNLHTDLNLCKSP